MDEMDQVRSDLGRPQALGRHAEVLGKRSDTLDVNLDSLGREIAQIHVLDHSLAQVSHGELLS